MAFKWAGWRARNQKLVESFFIGDADDSHHIALPLPCKVLTIHQGGKEVATDLEAIFGETLVSLAVKSTRTTTTVADIPPTSLFVSVAMPHLRNNRTSNTSLGFILRVGVMSLILGLFIIRFVHEWHTLQRATSNLVVHPRMEEPTSPHAVASTATIHYHSSEHLRTLLNHFWDSTNPWYKGVCDDVDAARLQILTQRVTHYLNTTTSRSSPSTEASVVDMLQLPLPPVNVHFDRGCEQMIHDSYSTGNLLELFYIMRIQSYAKQASLVLRCADAASTKYQLVVPWVFGNFTAQVDSVDHDLTIAVDTKSRRSRRQTVLGGSISGAISLSAHVTSSSACANTKILPIGRLYRDMQIRLRIMAIVVAGLPLHDPTHPSHEFARDYLNWPLMADRGRNRFKRQDATSNLLPLGFFQEGLLPSEPPDYNDIASLPPLRHSVQKEALDDVSIHFRCGDLMDSNHPEYEFSKFSVYAKIISPHARSIGIITSPFTLTSTTEAGATAAMADGNSSSALDNLQVREKDSTALLQERCRCVVTALVDYLQVRHPTARISVHNGRNETVMSSYVRLIMANQTIAGTSSTFGIFPTIASFGLGYLTSPYYNNSVPRTRWMLDEFGNEDSNGVDHDSNVHKDCAKATSTTGMAGRSNNVVIVQDNERAMVSVIQQLWRDNGADGVVAWFSS